MKKRLSGRLSLHRETLRRLDSIELKQAAGGDTTYTICPPCVDTDYGCDPPGGDTTLSCTLCVLA
jgi:hypothetical protein